MSLLCESSRVITPDVTRRPRTDPELSESFDILSGFSSSSDYRSLEIELTTFYFNSDPLAEYIALRELNFSTPEIYQTIITDSSFPYISASPEKENPRHYTLATTVRQHFRNKYLMMRLRNTKNCHGTIVSKFQSDVEKMLETPLVLQGKNLAAFCKLYDFYIEDKANEEIFNKARSFSNRTDMFYVDHEVTFAGSVERKAKDVNYTTYYWLTENQHLIAKRVKRGHSEGPLWEYLSKKGSINIRGNLITSKTIGHDFRIARIIGGNYEIYD